MHKDDSFLVKFLGSASVVSRYVRNLNPVPQVPAPGRLTRSFSQEDCGCVLVCCSCNALGFVAYQELSS